MDALENFVQQYVGQIKDEDDFFKVSQQSDAAQVDAEIEKNTVSKSTEKGKSGSQDDTDDSEESANLESHRTSDLESAQPELPVDDDSTPADAQPSVNDDMEAAEPLASVDDDGDEAQVQPSLDSDTPIADVADAVEDSADPASVLEMFQDDESVEVSVQQHVDSATIEVVPISSHSDSIREILDSQSHAAEISYSESPEPFESYGNLEPAIGTMEETDSMMSALPFMSLLGDRRRDQ
jgi:hypothetical protein